MCSVLALCSGLRSNVCKDGYNVTNNDSFQPVSIEWLADRRKSKGKRHAGTVERRLNSDTLPAPEALPVAKIESPEGAKMVKILLRQLPALLSTLRESRRPWISQLLP